MIKKSVFIFVVFVGLFSCKKEEKVADFTPIASVKSYTYNELKPLLEKKDDKTYVINFWATWCGPCIKELPYFEKINKEYKNKKVEVILVSLDFPKQVEKKLIPFINQKKIASRVLLLNDINEDVWIKAIDTTWSGAIPATLIYNRNKRQFYKQSFNYKQLQNELQIFLKP
jgi:thiol-disulfide isomerase/thioredoxin